MLLDTRNCIDVLSCVLTTLYAVSHTGLHEGAISSGHISKLHHPQMRYYKITLVPFCGAASSVLRVVHALLLLGYIMLPASKSTPHPISFHTSPCLLSFLCACPWSNADATFYFRQRWWLLPYALQHSQWSWWQWKVCISFLTCYPVLGFHWSTHLLLNRVSDSCLFFASMDHCASNVLHWAYKTQCTVHSPPWRQCMSLTLVMSSLWNASCDWLHLL